MNKSFEEGREELMETLGKRFTVDAKKGYTSRGDGAGDQPGKHLDSLMPGITGFGSGTSGANTPTTGNSGGDDNPDIGSGGPQIGGTGTSSHDSDGGQAPAPATPTDSKPSACGSCGAPCASCANKNSDDSGQ